MKGCAMMPNSHRCALVVVSTVVATSFTIVLTVRPASAATNACSNPVLATDLSGWGSLDRSWVTRDPVGDLTGVDWAFDTGGRRFYMPEVAVTAGETWTFAATDR